MRPSQVVAGMQQFRTIARGEEAGGWVAATTSVDTASSPTICALTSHSKGSSIATVGGLGIEVRVGLHTGEIELRDSDVAGRLPGWCGTM
jgi:hypothetical protein